MYLGLRTLLALGVCLYGEKGFSVLSSEVRVELSAFFWPIVSFSSDVGFFSGLYQLTPQWFLSHLASCLRDVCGI